MCKSLGVVVVVVVVQNYFGNDLFGVSLAFSATKQPDMSHKEFMSMSVRDLKEYLDGLGMNYAGYVILESLVVRESNIIKFPFFFVFISYIHGVLLTLLVVNVWRNGC